MSNWMCLQGTGFEKAQIKLFKQQSTPSLPRLLSAYWLTCNLLFIVGWENEVAPMTRAARCFGRLPYADRLQE